MICSKLKKNYFSLNQRQDDKENNGFMRLLAVALSLKIVKKYKCNSAFVCTLAESNYSVESWI